MVRLSHRLSHSLMALTSCDVGPPTQLMADPSSAFHALCMAQGQEEYDKLSFMAKI